MLMTVDERVETAVIEKAVAELAAAFGNRLVTSRCASSTGTPRPGSPASRLMPSYFPVDRGRSADGRSHLRSHRVPIIPFGTGTSLEGSVNAPFGGISIDLKDMNRVLAVHTEDFDCVVEPGITRKQLNEHLRDGLFFPVDPGADASLGGMASTRASGTTAVRYGTMKDNVLALKVVLPNGELMSTSRRARKSSAGYDLTRLIVGAEGTLGVITELTLKLHGIPEAVVRRRLPASRQSRPPASAAIAAIQSGIPVARVELLDEVQVRVCNAYSKLGLPEQPMLFLEFHGTEAGVAEQSERFGEIAARVRRRALRVGDRPEDRTRLWQARHDVYCARPCVSAGREGGRHRRVRADLAAGRMRHRDQARHRDEPGSSRRSSVTSATAISIASSW